LEIYASKLQADRRPDVVVAVQLGVPAPVAPLPRDGGALADLALVLGHLAGVAALADQRDGVVADLDLKVGSPRRKSEGLGLHAEKLAKRI